MNRPSLYIETLIVSHLAARPSRDLRAAAWQQITTQWWAQERAKYQLFTSELTIVEASAGDQEAAGSRLKMLRSIAGLRIDEEVRGLAAKLIDGGGVPPEDSNSLAQVLDRPRVPWYPCSSEGGPECWRCPGQRVWAERLQHR